MVQNIDDVLQRGEQISGNFGFDNSLAEPIVGESDNDIWCTKNVSIGLLTRSIYNLLFCCFVVLDDKAGNLRFQSEKYKKDATFLNLRSAYAKYAAVGTIFVVLMIYIRFWWFWKVKRNFE